MLDSRDARLTALAAPLGLDVDAPLVIGEPPMRGVNRKPPSSAPTMPTTTLRKIPCWASVRMTMLANQPSTPPTTNIQISPICFLLFFWMSA